MRTDLARNLRLAAALAALVAAVAAPGQARAANKIFAAGSLIIPIQQEYQTDEGAVATYGFIYSLLRHAEDSPLPTGCTKPFTIYWAIAPNKLSHHRCNTNTNTLPSYASYNDNDGCDFAIQSADGVPVAELTSAMTEAAPFNVFATDYVAASGPRRGAIVSVGNAAASPKKTVMKYLGGPWIIDATDRQCFLSMLKNFPELAQYHKNGASTVNANGKKAFVAIHSARASFTAPIARIMNRKGVLLVLGVSSLAVLFV
jgi:type IV pilus assembly protein PilY1